MMINTKELKEQHFFRDKDGHIVIWQWPNVPLWGWIIFKALSLLITATPWHAGFGHLSTAFLFTWAYLEITDGDAYFRRLLGLVVMIAIIASLF
jgi:hypothetical protein